MKLTMTPASGGPTDDLDELASMIRRAKALLQAEDSEGRSDGAPLRFRCRLTFGGKVRTLEITR